MNYIVRFTPVVAVVLGTACRDRVEPPTLDLTRDSAGVQIVEVSSETEPAVLQIVDTAVTRIGVADGPEQYLLHRVRGIRSLPDSSILVLNAGTHELRRYDTTGKWLSSFGRRGSGPLEMQFPLHLVGFRADSSLILDLTRRGFQVVDPAGRITRAQAVSSPLSGFVSLLDGSTALIAERSVPSGTYDQLVTSTVTVASLDLESSRRDTLLTLEGAPQYHYTHGELVRTVSVPFTVMPGVRGRDGRVYIADGRTPDLRIYDKHGSLVRILRLPLPSTTVRASEWDAAVNAMLESKARVTSGEGRLAPEELERQRRVIMDLPRLEVTPFFDTIDLNDPHRVWVRQYSPSGGTQTWIALDAEGRMTATATIPARVLVREITEEWVIGLEVDQSDVEYVVRYPFRRRK